MQTEVMFYPSSNLVIATIGAETKVTAAMVAEITRDVDALTEDVEGDAEVVHSMAGDLDVLTVRLTSRDTPRDEVAAIIQSAIGCNLTRAP